LGLGASNGGITNGGFGGQAAHIATFSGSIYQLDTAGEFVLAASMEPGNLFQVQARLQPNNNSSSASAITQIAALVGLDRVTFGIGRTDAVWVNGSPVALS